MNRFAFVFASALVLGTFGMAQAGEGSGHPFDVTGSDGATGQATLMVAGAPARDTGSEAYPAFVPGRQPVQANVAARDTGSDRYQDYAGQAAGAMAPVGVAEADR
jgi:hypothetical protein